ncbi:MAG: iron ABC transporter substrate-binding protein [Caldilineaceae bacterium]|nr:iron ABC transporter substrate-binding protein [Caldilineaceae bacterium]
MSIEILQMILATSIFAAGLLLWGLTQATRSAASVPTAVTAQWQPARKFPVWLALVALSLLVVFLVSACQPAAQSPTTQEETAAGQSAGAAETAPSAAQETEASQTLTIYSGRNENLVGPLLEQFRTESGIDVQVRYGDTAEMAATILEEGANSPADVFFAQDAGALGALADAGVLAPLPESVLAQVEPRFHSPDGLWVGVSGRARVLVYNTDELTAADLPNSVTELTGEEWRGRVGWAPSNGSFQSFVTALRTLAGEEEAQAWLEAMIANDVHAYANNTAIVTAVGAGEISVGLVNHYYLYRFLEEQGDAFPARNYHFPAGDVGSMINVAGVGILNTNDSGAAAEQLVAFLLSDQAQQYFATETSEYPLTGEGVELNPLLAPLDTIATPELDLNDLSDLQGTLELLQTVGALE